MKESMAAGLLLAAGWKKACDNLRSSTSENNEGLTLIDPMCGSGSLLLEAAMMCVDFAPGLMRIMNGIPGHKIPPVLRWKGNKETLVPIWKEMMMDASQRVKQGVSWLREHDGKIEIIGNDIHGGALELVESSLGNTRGLQSIVDLHHNDCCDWKIAKQEERRNQQIWVVTNPPWGVRLSDEEHESWESLRIFLRENCPAGRTQAWVLSGNKSATKHLGLRRSQSISLKTGQQDLRWLKYVMEERKWTESSRRETPSRELNSETSTEEKVSVSPVRVQRDVIDEKTARDSGKTPTRPTKQFKEEPYRSPSSTNRAKPPSSRTPVPLQLDDQNRLIRNRSMERGPTSSTLQRDDQKRLIRVRKSPDSSRIASRTKLAKKGSTSGDDSWS